jgi:hypothetical protein|tara:strand:- start:6081 stop:6752 length:672 start_codon:yes stop_codon:yes gene_type:complete
MLANKRCLILAIAILLSTSPIPSHSASDEWRLEKTTDGINIYSREYPSSDVREIKATTQLTSSIGSVVAVIEDIPSSARLNSIIAEARIESPRNNGRYQVYNHIAMPWPVKDRDISICRELYLDNETSIITIIDLACAGTPLKENLIRMTTFRQQWRLTPSETGTIKIEFTAHSEPGGPIPRWIINKMSTDVPYQILQNLEALSQLDPYVNSRIDETRFNRLN